MILVQDFCTTLYRFEFFPRFSQEIYLLLGKCGISFILKKRMFFKRRESELRLCGSLFVKLDDGGGDGPDLVGVSKLRYKSRIVLD